MAGIRFFEMSWFDIRQSNITITLDNNSDFADFLRDRNPRFIWQSTGSDDTDTITLTIDFGTSRYVDTLILTGHNLKAFEFERLQGASTWISVLDKTDQSGTVFFEQFTPFTTQSVRLKMHTTQVEDAQKTVQDVIITSQIGQLEGYPEPTFTPDIQTISKEMLDGRSEVVETGRRAEIDLRFKSYVGNADRALFQTIYNRVDPYLVWLCGGDETQFEYADEGYRLQDIYLMKTDRSYSHTFNKHLYHAGFNGQLSMRELA